MADYQALKDWLYGLQVFGIKLGLNSTENLLRSLDDPQKSFLAVHLAGTNGKGSTAAMLASILKEAGFRVGLYSSPHLVSFRERFLINGVMPSRAKLTPALARVRAVVRDEEPPTFFEFTTALAFEYFRENGVEIGVIETGLGGRLDATNILDPAATLITSIGLEHTEHLGPTIRSIAAEKAGIIKPGRPVATQILNPIAAGVIQARAAEVKAPLFRLGRDFRVRRTADGLTYRGLSLELKGLKMSLAGRHQDHNAALALAGLELAGRSGLPGGRTVSAEAVRRGLAGVSWPGRLQEICREPRIILDGAHNPPACRNLARVLDGIERRRLILVMGIMADKDMEAMLRALGPLADDLILTRAVYERSARPESLAAAAELLGLRHRVVPELTAAVDAARQSAERDDLILITGSLFVVGEVMAGLKMSAFPEEN